MTKYAFFFIYTLFYNEKRPPERLLSDKDNFYALKLNLSRITESIVMALSS